MEAENRNRRMASCALSKAAASHLVRSIAFGLGPMNIRAKGIAAGATRTDALQSALIPKGRMLAHTPIRRLGTPQDMANAALFLCGPAACRNWTEGGQG